jgi:Zn-dependent peptidase ImmA (M78 family)
MPKNFAQRRARKGTGVLPPNPKRWEHEHNALDLRQELDVSLRERLSVERAFSLLPDVHLCSSHELEVEECFKNHFAGARSGHWSGMCLPCPNGITLVLYNANHPETRTRATLMEEFFHLWLEHPPDRLRLFSDGEGRREFDGSKESEAYGSGAAALLPYEALKGMLTEGRTVPQIADHFLVSKALVKFRLRVTKVRARRKGA